MDYDTVFSIVVSAVGFAGAAGILCGNAVERNRDRMEVRAEKIAEELRRHRDLREQLKNPTGPGGADPLDRPPVPLNWFEIEDVIWLAGVGLLPWAQRIVEELNQYPALKDSILNVPEEKHSRVEFEVGTGRNAIITAADMQVVRRLIGYEKR